MCVCVCVSKISKIKYPNYFYIIKESIDMLLKQKSWSHLSSGYVQETFLHKYHAKKISREKSVVKESTNTPTKSRVSSYLLSVYMQEAKKHSSIIIMPKKNSHGRSQVARFTVLSDPVTFFPTLSNAYPVILSIRLDKHCRASWWHLLCPLANTQESSDFPKKSFYPPSHHFLKSIISEVKTFLIFISCKKPLITLD